MIGPFLGEYRFLSNFWSCEVTFEGDAYPSVEHAYQASKTIIMSERNHVKRAETPGIAKRRGRKVTLKEGFDGLSVMELLLMKKFQNDPLRSQLLATGTEEIIEVNYWRDRFWGQYKGTGENHLGRLLMKIRAQAQDICPYADECEFLHIDPRTGQCDGKNWRNCKTVLKIQEREKGGEKKL